MIRLSLNEIRKIANDSFFKRGAKYYNTGHVKDISITPNCFIITVEGTELYEVVIEFNQHNGELIYTECNCPAYYKYYGACKHIVAALMSLLYKQDEINKQLKNVVYDKVIDSFSNVLSDHRRYEKKIVNLEIVFSPQDITKSYTSSTFNLRIGFDRLYLVKNIKELIQVYKSDGKLHFGKEFTYDGRHHTFHETDRKFLEVIDSYYSTENYIINTNKFTTENSINSNEIALPEIFLIQLLKNIQNREFTIKYKDLTFRNMNIHETLSINFSVTRKKDFIDIKILDEPDFFKLTNDSQYIFYDNHIYKLSKDKRNYFNVINNAFNNEKKLLQLKESYKHHFASSVLPVLQEFGSVALDHDLASQIVSEELICEIHLDKFNDSIKGTLCFSYDEYKIGIYPPSTPRLPEEAILVRDVKNETKILSLLNESSCNIPDSKEYFTISNDEEIYDFIYYHLPRLQEFASIYYSENFKNIHLNLPHSYQGGVRLNENTDMLEFSFNIDGIDKSELPNIIRSINEKKKFYKLKNGGFLPLENEETESFSTLINHLNLNVDDFNDDMIQLPKYRAFYIDSILRESNMKGFSKNHGFKKLVQDIKEPGDMDFDIPSELSSILRDYQKFGFKWLKTMGEYGFGGILADDMGLGKTIQSIALITSYASDKPSLIVAPTSLIYNWEDEINKFSPELTTLVISGNKNSRKKAISNINNTNVVITSYGSLKQDIDDYKNFDFAFCFVDEAQHIKNPTSLNAKSVKLISARNRFALTGTPIENSLTELWSIFDFIMPGYLLSHNKFVNNYERPIIKFNDTNALNNLSKQIKPFILRRLKKDVLSELPPKIETKITTELSSSQKKLYMAFLEKTKSDLKFTSANYNKNTIKILAALTRLRQICCHPALFMDDYKGDSNKLSLLEEIVLDAIDSNHRILIFSQFTSMLKIIYDMLIKNKISSFFLDGKTPSEDRRDMVHRFNDGEKEVFLISLKAGGTGLNLTGADMVIHYDPWWNPAVEDQATDRAYRIGQNKSVQVIKLITVGTIEEKIYKLQQQKKSVIDSVIKPGETLINKLDESEIRELFEL